MSTNPELFHAILAMDAYNRGYNAGVNLGAGLGIGQAQVYQTSEIFGPDVDSGASFYAIAYSWHGETVISYRGTDSILFDVPSYPLALGNYNVTQARLAAQFYLGLANQLGVSNISLTGHSLGGGLAGFISGLYGSEATLFDNMPFEEAVNNFALDFYNPEFGSPEQLAPFSQGTISPALSTFRGNIGGYYHQFELFCAVVRECYCCKPCRKVAAD